MNEAILMREAKLAVEHTRSVLPIGAANADLANNPLKKLATRAVDAWRGAEIDISMLRTETRIRYVAQRGMMSGAGNCGENAAIAYLYLKEHAPAAVGTIRYMVGYQPSLRDRSKVIAAHAFVIIGAPGVGLGEQGAVVVDPWADRATPTRSVWGGILPGLEELPGMVRIETLLDTIPDNS